MEEVTSASDTFVRKNSVSTDGLKIRQLKMRANYFTVFMTLVNFALIFAAGHFRDFLRLFGYLKCSTAYDTKKNKAAKIQPIVKGFTAFFIRHVGIYAQDSLNRPLASTPGAEIEILERKRTTQFHTDYKHTGRVLKSLNFGSYNYLGELQQIMLYSMDCMLSFDRYRICSEQRAVRGGVKSRS